MEALPITPWFSWACRELARACAALDLEAPSFRSPPAVPGADRTWRRVPGDGACVAVRLWGRSFDAIRADLVEGILVVNGRAGADADRLRSLLESAAPLPEASRAA